MRPRIDEAMAKKIFSVLPDTPIREAYEYMKEKRVRHLLVIDRDDVVMGLLSDRDLNRAMTTRVEKTDSLKIVAEHFNPEDEVQDYMSWDIKTMNVESSIRKVGLMMLQEKISSVVITDDRMNVRGIITTDDLIWILVKMLDEEESSVVEAFKSEMINSPLGTVVNTLNQAGI